MGFYFGRATETARGDVSPSITPREYVSALAAATDLLRDPGPSVHGGSRRLEARLDAESHRLVGLSHLAGGRVGLAARHLEIALGLVRRVMPRALGMTEALRLQCEAARLSLVLVRLYVRLGEIRQAHALAREIQAML
jgi:hypothetical protein